MLEPADLVDHWLKCDGPKQTKNVNDKVITQVMENTQAALICMCVDTPGWGICFSKEPIAWKTCGLYWGVLSLRIHCIQDVFSSSEKLRESKNKRAQRKPKKALLVKENAFVTIC